MVKRIFSILFILSLIMAMPIQAAEFPTKEVQIIIPWAAGGATDLIFRALAATTGKYLGKAVVVVNRPGGAGAVGYTEAMQGATRWLHTCFCDYASHHPSPSGEDGLHLQRF